MSYPYLIQGNNLVVVIGNKSHTISKTHVSYQKVVDAIKAGDWDTVKSVIDPVKVVLNYGAGHVSIQGEKLFWKGELLNTALAHRMIVMLQEGFPIEPMVNFMENLMQNPSKRAVDELYTFLEKNKLPITPDGCFLAFKNVNSDYMDSFSSTVLNKPAYMMSDEELATGKWVSAAGSNAKAGVVTEVVDGTTVVSMERNAVDDNKDRTCSDGLHFAAEGYHYGGPVTLILKINPRDVVSIPSDHNDQKGRTCRYEVNGVLGVEREDAFDKSVQAEANGTVNPATAWPWPTGE
jgi:hypothetical protein